MEVKQRLIIAAAENICEEFEALIESWKTDWVMPLERVIEMEKRISEYRKIVKECSK